MQLFWAEAALHDLRSARDHVAGNNPAAAEALVVRIESSVARLVAFPEIGRGLAGRLRVLSVSHTPFRLLYRADTSLGIIQILAVWHGARQWPFGPD